MVFCFDAEDNGLGVLCFDVEDSVVGVAVFVWKIVE